MTSSEQNVRELAYYLWLSEGKPEGASDRHWKIATKIATEQNKPGSPFQSIDPSQTKGTTEPEQPDQT